MKIVLSKVVLFALAVALTVSLAMDACLASNLLSYVRQPDDSYHWEKVSQSSTPTGSKTILSLTSQTWQGIVWKHSIELYVPSECKYPQTAMLIITGGGGGGESAMVGQIVASVVKCPVAILFQIPNQPLFDGKHEDALIALTFSKALETGDMTWPLLLPMTKSAVRAMDAVQAYSKSEMNTEITGFVVGGASKRGWTTWLTGAADPARVKGIVPMVYDNLNLEKQMKLQLNTYGAYSLQIQDYTDMQLQEKLNTDAGKALANAVDPWAYKDRITMPKLIINGTNDPYWTLASLNTYWDGLRGDKAVVYVPNAGHDLGAFTPTIEGLARVTTPIAAFVRAIASGNHLPKMSWKCARDVKTCKLILSGGPDCTSAKLWVAKSQIKDFRQAKWESQPMSACKKGFTGSVNAPKSGYLAVMGEAAFTTDNFSYTLSTQVTMYE